MSGRRSRVVLALTLLAGLVLAGVAWAAAPANDERDAPQELALPAAVSGTTAGATVEADEPGSCNPIKGSVWYEIRPAQDQRIAVRLRAGGDLDAVVDVFHRVRSQLTPVDCDSTDSGGRAELSFAAKAGADYLLRVAQRANSVAGTFQLDVFAPQPPPHGPGRALPRHGARGVLDALQHTSDAYAFRMRAGRSYRINLVQPEGGCVSLGLYAPGTRDFGSSSPVRSRACGGYLLYTPGAGQGGRYSLLVQAAARRRGRQPYHLQAAPARPDDTAPGRPLENYHRVHGTLHGNRVDAVDLYRFSIARRSDVRLTLARGSFGLRLVGEAGRHIASASDGEPLELRMAPGRYFVAVVAPGGARGGYVLERATRVITQTSITIDGHHAATAPPGRTLRVGVHVAPGAAGPVILTLDRFDPLAGWQFFRQVALHAAGGMAVYAFTPPAEGRWRAHATFSGTRIAAPSASGFAYAHVASPLARLP